MRSIARLVTLTHCKLTVAALASAALLLSAGAAAAKDKIKVAAPHPTLLHTMPTLLAQSFGMFDKEGLEVEALWTAGGADTLQAATVGSVDVALQVGLAAVLSAVQQNAPIIVAANDFIGASEFVWYARTDKPIKALSELTAANSIAFSRPGASSETVLKALLEHAGVKPRIVPAGGPPETLVQVMSGQVDVGWATPPLFKEFAAGRLRIIARGNDAPRLRGMSSRVHAANAGFARSRPDVLKRFLKAFNAAIDGLYSDPAVQAKAAELIKISPAEIPGILKDFYPREAFTMSRIGDIDSAIALALANKQLRAPLTPEQIAGMQRTAAEFAPK